MRRRRFDREMLKLIGAILLIAGTASCGIIGAMRLRRRSDSLSSVLSALSTMKSEICDRLTPIPELLEMLAEDGQYPANALFSNACANMSRLGSAQFSEIWNQSVEKTPELLLNARECEVLSELGKSLGKYNIEEQRSALLYALDRFSGYLKKAESSRAEGAKMRAAIGVAAGIFAVVILI